MDQAITTFSLNMCFEFEVNSSIRLMYNVRYHLYWLL